LKSLAEVLIKHHKGVLWLRTFFGEMLLPKKKTQHFYWIRLSKFMDIHTHTHTHTSSSRLK